MASSSSSSCSRPPQDQVFINFRGKELRGNFVSRLRDALKGKDINVFIDKNQGKGKKVEGLLEEIERSKIALAIFSPRYTESDWCLKELARMRERMEQGKLVVIPIFYKVKPSVVDEQRGDFGDKFKDLVKVHKEEKKEWKKALKCFATSQGCELPPESDEGPFIADIVEHVLDALNNKTSGDSTSNPPSPEGTDLSRTVHQKNVESYCGIESRFKQLEEKLSFGSGETTRIVGVVGPPGIGKSTLVEKLYEKSKKRFLRNVFIPDVHQTTKEDGLLYLLEIIFSDETFASMINMRYLKIYSTRCPQECDRDIILNFPAGLQLPLGELRCLHWLKFPLKELPQDFDAKNLVDLKLPYSKIEKVWEGDKDASKLKWIDFNHSKKLCTLSGFGKAKKLQELNLEGCTALKTLPQDMENMDCLVFLNLRGCTSLECLPQISLGSLKIVILTDCSLFQEFHVISEKLEAIHLDGTAIKKLHDDIKKLQLLALLNMKGCKKLKTLPNTLGELKALQELILSGCSKLKKFPKDVENMESLEILLLDETAIEDMPNIPSLRRIRLSRNEKICRFPENISQFSRLKWLDMKYCKSVTHLPKLPPNIQCINAHGCSSLRTIAQPLAQAIAPEHIRSTFIFTNCNGLEQAAKEEIASYAQRKCQLLPSALKLCNKDLVHEILFSACFPGDEIPSWFSHEAIGSKVQFKYPQHWNYNKLSGIALCAVVSFQNCQDQTEKEQEHTNYLSVKFTCKGTTEEEPCTQITWKIGSWSEQGNKIDAIEAEHVFIGYTNCVHLIKHLEDKKPSECAPSVAFLEFSVTDENTTGEARFEVLKSGFSFVFEPDEKKSKIPDANSVATPRTNGGQILPYLTIIVKSFTTLILCVVLIVLLISVVSIVHV